MTFPGGVTGTSIDAMSQDFMNISHNLANVDTVGFKKKSTAFSRELDRQLNAGNEPTTNGAVLMNDRIDYTQGILRQTNRNLDVAISGSGFFVIETDQGPRFTRNGVFQIDSTTGQLVDANGRLVAGENGPIVIPPGIGEAQVTIAPDGTVSAGQANVGQIKVVDFGMEDNQRLLPTGNCYFMAPEDLETKLAFQRGNVRPNGTSLSQGHIEKSNVDTMQETVNLVQILRLYEMNVNYLNKRRELSKSMLDVAKST